MECFKKTQSCDKIKRKLDDAWLYKGFIWILRNRTLQYGQKIKRTLDTRDVGHYQTLRNAKGAVFERAGTGPYRSRNKKLSPLTSNRFIQKYDPQLNLGHNKKIIISHGDAKNVICYPMMKLKLIQYCNKYEGGFKSILSI